MDTTFIIHSEAGLAGTPLTDGECLQRTVVDSAEAVKRMRNVELLSLPSSADIALARSIQNEDSFDDGPRFICNRENSLVFRNLDVKECQTSRGLEGSLTFTLSKGTMKLSIKKT